MYVEIKSNKLSSYSIFNCIYGYTLRRGTIMYSTLLPSEVISTSPGYITVILLVVCLLWLAIIDG